MDGLRNDQKQTGDNEQEQIDGQEGSQKEEIGENSGSITSTQLFHGRVPQLQVAEERKSVECAMVPHLKRGKWKPCKQLIFK